MYRKDFDESLGECQDFSSKLFCFTVSKTFAGQPFRVSLISGMENFYAQRGYVTNFCQNIFSITVPEHFVEEPLCAVFQKSSSSENSFGEEGGGRIKIFRRKFYISQCRKISEGTSSVCH